jgi:hypothetical protein
MCFSITGVGGWVPKKFLARHQENDDTDVTIRLEGGSEQVAAEISFVSSLKMIIGASCHHATRKAPDLPLLGEPTAKGLGRSSPKGGQPILFVRWKRLGAKNAMVMLA